MNVKVISQKNKVTVKSNNAAINSSTIPTKVIVSSNVGVRGYSEYEIAQRNGFTGTEQEWLDRRFEQLPDSINQLIDQKFQEQEEHIIFNQLPQLP